MNSLYLYNALSTAHGTNENDDMYFISRLLNFRNEIEFGKIKPEKFAENLLSVISKKEGFEDICRACLSLRYPLSNKVGILSSHNNFEENLMKTYYSCYVSPETSLNSNKPGTFRNYGDIDQILESFVESGQPVQKSIFLLSKMGVKSGLTIFLQAGDLKGYLFLNSKKKNYFNNFAKDHSTYLNLMQLIANEFFHHQTKDIFSTNEFDEYINAFKGHKSFSNIHLEDDHGEKHLSELMTHKLSCQLELKVEDQTDHNNLLPWGQISLLTNTLLKELNAEGNLKLIIKLTEQENKITISLKSSLFENKISNISTDHYKSIRKFAKGFDIELIKQKDYFVFQMDVEASKSAKNIAYSIIE